MTFRHRLEQYFQFQSLGADWRTEILAGVTTFMTISATASKLDVRATLGLGFLEIVFVFLVIDLFDNTGSSTC